MFDPLKSSIDSASLPDTAPGKSSVSSTVGLPTRVFRPDPDTEGTENNSPNTPLDREKLEIDEFLVDRLTHKPPEKYKFRKSIARGGMKMVIQVKDMDATRDVAMAILPDAAARPPADILRFVQEARLTASLEHPNIVPVHDIGIDSNGAPYFTMKLLRGQTLAALLTRLASGDKEFAEMYSLNRLLRIFLKICYGAAFAHSKGVIHLDLKPENIQIGDFGEVLIMDWGLAKVIENAQTPDEDGTSGPATRSAPAPVDDPYVTIDGVTKGTPGYMAPEQAAGRNHQKDCRTDIYALGAILYTMITLCDPIEKKPVPDMIRDTLEGNIVPPHLRAPEREIPSALEAVVQKAMSLSPADRYASVKELRNEVNAFIGGYATKAERANLLKQAMLWVKRHAILTGALAVIFFLLTLFTIFAIHEFGRRNPPWLCVLKRDFIANRTNDLSGGMTFLDKTLLNPVPPWELTASGLVMRPQEWLWLDCSMNEDMKLAIEFIPASADDFLEISLNSVTARLKSPDDAPPGYLFRFGADGGVRDLIYRNAGERGTPRQIAASVSGFRPGVKNRAVFLREGETLSILNDNGEPPLAVSDFIPPVSSGEKFIGLRAATAGVRIVSVSVYTRRMPEQPTPLIAADALTDVHLYRQAMEKYLHIVDDYPRAAFSDLALLKAYRIAAYHLPRSVKPQDRAAAMLNIKKRIAARTAFAFVRQVDEVDAGLLWQEGRYQEGLRLAEGILQVNPKSDVLMKMLARRRNVLPPPVINEFYRLLHLMKPLRALDISGIGATSLEGLRGLNLVYLDCSGNRLTNLAGIEGMPLSVLVCRNNPNLPAKATANAARFCLTDNEK